MKLVNHFKLFFLVREFSLRDDVFNKISRKYAVSVGLPVVDGVR